MRRVLQFFDRLDSGLRWALFLPVGIIMSVIVVGIVDQLMWMATGYVRVGQAVKENAMLAFMAALTRTLFPAVISPRPWVVAIIMFAADFLLRIAPFVSIVMFGPEYQRARLPEVWPIVFEVAGAGVAGGLIGLYLVRVVMASTIQPQNPVGD